jgi:hypothetical protein
MYNFLIRFKAVIYKKEVGMKKLAVLVVVMAVTVYAMPAFANCGTCGKEKTPFQIIADTITVKGQIKEKNKLKPIPREQVNLFQALADGIKEGSAKAKLESLRNK